MAPRVLVLGGYGAFGAHVVDRLARGGDVALVVAGRSAQKARALVRAVADRHGVTAEAAVLDAGRIQASDLETLKPAIVINAAGPFQAQEYQVARAAIDAGAHYIDLSDARDFTTGIGALDGAARSRGVLVTSGASSVPALSAAAVDAYRARFGKLQTVTSVISPGNSFDPGIATTRSILGTLGRPFPALRNGRETRVYGWQGLERVAMPGLGKRWIGDCDAPDLALFPLRYPGLESVRVCAALEVGTFHLGLWAASGLARAGLLRRPERLAGPLLALKRRMRALGSDRGGMTVTLVGTTQSGTPSRFVWSLVARNGHGPIIPATPSVIIARKLLEGRLQQRGAMAAVGHFTLEEFRAAVADLDIVEEVTA